MNNRRGKVKHRPLLVVGALVSSLVHGACGSKAAPQSSGLATPANSNSGAGGDSRCPSLKAVDKALDTDGYYEAGSDTEGKPGIYQLRCFYDTNNAYLQIRIDFNADPTATADSVKTSAQNWAKEAIGGNAAPTLRSIDGLGDAAFYYKVDHDFTNNGSSGLFVLEGSTEINVTGPAELSLDHAEALARLATPS